MACLHASLERRMGTNMCGADSTPGCLPEQALEDTLFDPHWGGGHLHTQTNRARSETQRQARRGISDIKQTATVNTGGGRHMA